MALDECIERYYGQVSVPIPDRASVPFPSAWARLLAPVSQWQTRLLVGLSLVIGAGAGLGAYGFRWLIAFARELFWARGAAAIPWSPIAVVLIPAVGGALVGLLVYFLAREAKGHGVPEVMLAIAEKGGRIRFRIVFVKALASALCIGSGGSAGREGPIVQIGSALGSGVGQALKLPADLLRTVVAAGAAGGIAATFNAPIAGVVFSLEVLLRDFSARAFSVVVLASVTATVISRALLGDHPAFVVPPYALRSPWELIVYALLGVLAALLARLFIWSIYRVEDFFNALRMPEYLKPILGGLGVGVLALALPQVLGVGYETVEESLQTSLPLALLIALIGAKVVATSLTLGSGGSGGIFSPSLFMGAMLGGAVGTIAHRILPDVTGPSGAYALVAMAAVFGGVAHAPIASILIIFEMTDDYRIILPLMTAVVISTLLSHVMSPETIYTLKLRRRGVDILAPRGVDPFAGVHVGDVMNATVITLQEFSPLPTIVESFRRHSFSHFPVLDARGRLIGMLSYDELQGLLASEVSPDGLTAGRLMRVPPAVSHPDELLADAVEKMAHEGLGWLPVVPRDDHTKLVGVVSRRDALNAYRRSGLGVRH